MKNHELLDQLYRSLLVAHSVGQGESSEMIIEECILLIEKERPELKSKNHHPQQEVGIDY